MLIVKHAVIFATTPWITLADLPPGIPDTSDRGESWGASLKKRLEQVERDLILEALNRCGNCRTTAAAVLCISRITLYNKMKKLGIVC